MAEIDDDISALRTVLRETDWTFESHQYSTEWQYTASCDRISRIVARIDAQAAEIERLHAALLEIHGEFIHGSRKLYTTPDAALDRIRAAAANALEGAK